uniref:Uncharacterized protein n=1 Tax=Siphoviridae sp. ctfeV1 TaxID=2826417 RepID=A0A8S5MRP3_9CAUD|nr:MAG TPA: hypothetical protein [Siphoviridae sp. ctfeV1]
MTRWSKLTLFIIQMVIIYHLTGRRRLPFAY